MDENINENLKKLEESVTNLNKSIKQELSIKYNFFISIVRGIGYAIGATIIAGLLVAVLAKTFQSIPGLNKINIENYKR